MRIIPKSQLRQIGRCRVLATRWSERADELSLDPAQIAELQLRVGAAIAAHKKQAMARDAARSATGDLKRALEAMTSLTATLIQQVRATAAREGKQVYLAAALPIPKSKGSKIGKPGKPCCFTVELQQVGWLVLRWKCLNPRGAVGTMYHVHRQLQSADGTWGPREFLGIAGKKEYTDSTLPPGCAGVQYHVRAIRSTAYGEEANHLVHFSASFRHGAPGQMQLAA